MDSELQETFNSYVKEFKKQSIGVKRKEIIESLKELISVLDVISAKDNLIHNYLRSREITDMQKEIVSEDDFLEALLIYVENVKNMISEYLIYKDLI